MREKASSMCRLRTTNVSDERHKLVHGVGGLSASQVPSVHVVGLSAGSILRTLLRGQWLLDVLSWAKC